MSDGRKNRKRSGKQQSILEPGEIERAQGGGTAFGMAPGPGRGGPPLGGAFSDREVQALRLDSLPGSRTLGAAPAPGSERASAAQQPKAGSSAPRIIDRQEVAPDLLRLRVEKPSGLDFRAGQHVKFGLPGNLRSYTLVSDPEDSELEFFIELQPGGRLSGPLRSVAAGTPMALGSAAKGSFVVDPSVSNHVFVATVTGIAPFVSILRDQARRGFPGGRFVVLHGASYAQELGYGDEIGTLASAHPDRVQYLPTVSCPDEIRNRGWSGARGRVDDLAAQALSSLAMPTGDTAVYACGNSGMIRNVRALAERQGLRFHAEAFD
ncbi:MAG: hypothetical protein JJT88_00685 [Gammaproteobacteria bacterium]|nr:hypothetical protein [Gammaproteobacteria bacterium]